MAISAWTLLGVQMSTTSMSGRFTTARQSDEALLEAEAPAGLLGLPVGDVDDDLAAGIAGAGQKNMGIAA